MHQMNGLARHHSRFAAFVAALLSVGLMASTGFAACCGHCHDSAPKAATAASAHDCCAGKGEPAQESLRAECAGCHAMASGHVATLTRAESSEKAPLAEAAPVFASGLSIPAPQLSAHVVSPAQSPPASQANHLSSIVLIL
ncbi:MAG: hypothetical protein KDH09_19490 [Chrysiogenetes bacterium]|nr:hypothetical protein [Chrysiogenetes bacterium]